MKIVSAMLMAIVVATSLITLTGCDPTKLNNGGLPQPYNPANGQFK